MDIKNLYTTIAICCFALLAASPSFAQNKTIDSLKTVLQTQKEDTNKVNTLLLTSSGFFEAGQFASCLTYSKQALMLSKKLEFLTGKRNAYFQIIAGSSNLNNIIDAFHYSYEALEFYKLTRDSFMLGRTFQFLGAMSTAIDDDTEALKHYLSALEIRQKINEKTGIAQTLNSIGTLYCEQGKLTEAMEHHVAALKICKDPAFNGADWSIPFTNQSIAAVYEKSGDMELAHGNRASAKNYFERALKIYEMVLKEYIDTKKIDGVAELNYMVGNIHTKLNHFDLAKVYLQKSLQTYSQTDSREFFHNLFLSLSLLDSAQGNYKSAYSNFKLYAYHKGIIKDEYIIHKVESFKVKDEFEKKDYQINLLEAESKLKSLHAREQHQKKNIAYAGIGLILLAGGCGFYLFRKRKRIQSRQALSNERLRISQELHDEVGATLSGISMYSHLTKEQMKHAQTAEVEKSLNIMQHSAGEMVNKLNDIVWLINPGQDTLQKLIQRLEDYAGEMAAIKNMQVKITVPEQFSSYSLPVESRRNIYLFCKEAINNAVKYSGGSMLELTVKESNQLLEIGISDNGKGFDVENVKRGNGLDNMQKRATELGAAFNLQSTPGQGCSITLQVKITQ